ncbi:hypothetical protein GCM10027047_00650 [Rhodococcus aerolatus]
MGAAELRVPRFSRYVLEDCVGDGDRGAGRIHVTSGTDVTLQHFHVATFLTLRNGLVHEMVEVWTGVAEPAGPRPA